MFHPGSTAVHTFTIPFNKGTLAQIIISYWQNDHIVIERILTSTDPNFEQAFSPMKHWTEKEKAHTSKFYVQLTESESLQFEDCDNIIIQLNVYTTGGSRHTSYIIRNRDVGRQLHRNEEVILDA